MVRSTATDELIRMNTFRTCFREPIPELERAAELLSSAVDAHLAGQAVEAAERFAAANDSAIRDWLNSVWGANSAYVQVRDLGLVRDASLKRHGQRMPTLALKRQLHQRDGYHCRFCNLAVIRPEVRAAVHKTYPDAVPWGHTNASQHAAFQAMWAQYDHLLPHSLGGNNELDNLVVACAACNFGRMDCTLEEVGLLDPRERAPAQRSWDGLERFLQPTAP
jgi:hypothetical protein